MKSIRISNVALIAIVALALGQMALASDATGSFSKTLTVSGTPEVSIMTGSGHINVRAGNTNSVIIEGRIKANDNWSSWFGGGGNLSAEERIKRIEANPPIVQSGNTITIGKIDDSDLRQNISISYDVTVPAATKLESRTGSGGVEIDSLQGPVKAESGSGGIRVSKITNDVHLNTGSGGIQLDGAEGKVSAHTGSGHIRLYNINGGLDASTGSGGIEAEGNATRDWELHTGSGGIRVRLPQQAGFKVDAHSGSGGVRVNHPLTMQGSLRRNHIEGTVGNGGPMLTLRTGSGGIQID
ncbi:MAG: hypothetical protein JWO20_2734 [Candidatus Angelobacter sp.]|jgi:DUF4097 and DUF4098 domain-containing protein YvlB|nr:hypothetical protein [Candidatus Angelobacter sp.]